MKLWNYLKEKMLNHPNQLVCEGNAEISFEDLVVWVEAFSKRLDGLNSCAILCQSEMAAAMSLLVCVAKGVTAIPLSIRYGEKHCSKIIETISPEAIITDANGKFEVLDIAESKYQAPKEHPALIMCTSGTTGNPKGAMLSESNIITNVTDIASYFAIEETDTILISRPLYHCAVLTGEFLTALVKGTKIRFYSEQFNPMKMLELIRDYKITAFCGTPTLLGMMARLKKSICTDTLKHICISGECMGKEIGLRIADAFSHSDIYYVYGLTEACPRVSYLPPHLFRKHPDCVGYPLKSVSLKLKNEHAQECAPNEDGFLWVKGGNIMMGYYNEPKKTEDILKDGWLFTGDIATITDEGLLKIKGRCDDLIIKGGMNIYPVEIESVMKLDIRTKDVLVYGIKTRYGTQIGMTISGDYKSIEEVKRACMDYLPPFQVPAFISIVEELPKNGTGKIIRRK